jgi:hypothetical protein
VIDLKDQANFLEAINLAKAGRTKEAYPQLARLAQRYPGEAEVLIWLAYTSPDLLEAREAIYQATAIDSYNPSLTLARSWLETEMEQQSQLSTAPVLLDDMPTQIFYWRDVF